MSELSSPPITLAVLDLAQPGTEWQLWPKLGRRERLN
jgi:hypothetical protein